MDDVTKYRFDAVEKLIEHTEKRFDDVKWYFGGAATLFTVGFSILTLILSWNYKSERDGLRDFEKDIKTELGRIDAPPDLQVLGVDRMPLAGQEVASTVDKDKDGWAVLHVNLFLKNRGATPTGQMYMKLYGNDPI